MISISCLLFCTVYIVGASEIEWLQGNTSIWSSDCDFPENNLNKVTTRRGMNCSNLCKTTHGCTHYVYFNNWCYLKQGLVTTDKAIAKKGMSCGIINEKLSKI